MDDRESFKKGIDFKVGKTEDGISTLTGTIVFSVMMPFVGSYGSPIDPDSIDSNKITTLERYKNNATDLMIHRITEDMDKLKKETHRIPEKKIEPTALTEESHCEDCKYFYLTDVAHFKTVYSSIRSKEVEIEKIVNERSCGYNSIGITLDQEQPICSNYKES